MAALVEAADAAPESKSGISLERLDAESFLPDRADNALKRAIMAKRIYDSREDLRRDERELARDLGISRLRFDRRCSRFSTKAWCAPCHHAAFP